MRNKKFVALGILTMLILALVALSATAFAAGPTEDSGLYGDASCICTENPQDGTGVQHRYGMDENPQEGNSWGEPGEGTGPGLQRQYGKSAHE